MHLMQANLFSLNGFFNWTEAQTSAHTFTTCGLFVRACRAAALLLESKNWATNTPQGTDPCITGPNPKGARGKGVPRRGDIFHVVTPGETNDHVGIIVETFPPDANGSWNWQTVEGGQGSGYLTQFFDRKLVLDNDGQRYHGGNKGEMYARPLVKWIDLDALAAAL